MSSQPSFASEGSWASHGAPSSGGSGILHDDQVSDFEAALRWAIRGIAPINQKVLARRSLAQNFNAAMIGLVEALHYQTVYTCQMTNWQKKFNL